MKIELKWEKGCKVIRNTGQVFQPLKQHLLHVSEDPRFQMETDLKIISDHLSSSMMATKVASKLVN